MKITKIINSYFQENTYLFKLNDKIYLIDPGNDYDKIISLLDGENLDYILLTHGHMDHIASVKKLQNKYRCKTYLSKKDECFVNGEIILDPFFDTTNYNINFIDYSNFNEKDIIIIETPGHSEGSVSIYIKKEKIIFSGDTLFKESFGRYDFPFGNFLKLKNSISYLFCLDEDIIIYPGHGEKTTIKEEKIKNIIKFY